MIEKETVVPIKNGFYEAGKINPHQPVYGRHGLVMLNQVSHRRDIAVLVETKHYSIIVSPQTRFYTSDGTIQANRLTGQEQVLTDDDYEALTNITVLDGIYDLFELETEDGSLKANGFYITR